MYLKEHEAYVKIVSCLNFRYFFVQPTYWCGKDYRQIYRDWFHKTGCKQNIVGDDFGGKIIKKFTSVSVSLILLSLTPHLVEIFYFF